MKLRYLSLFALAFALTACNFTLAEDVTPPPGYIPPTPMPTLVMVPPQTPNVANGAAIYAEKCAPCHGETGLGDGPQGIQLGVTVKAFGLPEIGRPASPAEYFTVVTRGNMERLMPPFNSLNDQQRWDVVAYALTLHTTPEQVARGKQLFEENCTNCSTDFFRNQTNMAPLTGVALARLAREGNGSDIPAFGANLSDDDLWAVAAYLRTLSFDTAPLAQPTTAPDSQTPVAAEAGTPVAEGTVLAAGFGTVSGKVESVTGSLPADLTITLRGYDHGGSDPSGGAQEVFSAVGVINADGTYIFENVELPENRIFLLDAAYSGVSLQSEPGVALAGQSALELAPLRLYAIGTDTSKLVVDEVSLFFHARDATTLDVLGLYSFRNPGPDMIMVKMAEQQEIPFIKFPQGAEGLGYEAMQDSARFVSMDDGFAMTPGEVPYGIVAYASLQRAEKQTSITQEVVLPVSEFRILVPDGMEVKGANIKYENQQDVQGTLYQSYLANNIAAGSKLTFELSGQPTGTDGGAAAATNGNNWLLYGAGGLGALLIAGGAWLYLRDRSQKAEADLDEEEADEAESEFETSEEVLDAIVTLDDLHRDKKISDEAYQKRRAELKEMLKGLM